MNLTLNNNDSAVFVHHTKTLGKKNPFTFPIILSTNYKLIYDNFEISVENTVEKLLGEKRILKSFKLVKITLLDYEDFLEIATIAWVWHPQGLWISKCGHALNRNFSFKSVNTRFFEGTVGTDFGTMSFPRLIYSSFSDMKYEDIYAVSFKNGNNRDNSFDNLIVNHITDLEVDFNESEITELMKPHKLYVVLLKEVTYNEIFAKVGVTKHNVEKRFKSHSVEVMKSIEFDFENGVLARGYESFIIERLIPVELRLTQTMILTGGRTECFRAEYHKAILEIVTTVINKTK